MSHKLIDVYPLLDFLSHEVIDEAYNEKSGNYGFIYLWDYFFILSFLYETGAILGCARREKPLLLEKMIAQTKSSYYISDYQKMAKEHLQSYRNQFTKEPDTFYEFIFKRELENFTGPNPSNISQQHSGYDDKKLTRAYNSFNKRYLALLDEKVRIKESENTFLRPAKRDDAAKVRRHTLEGIGFGIAFPELTEKMNLNFWDSIRGNMDELSQKWIRPDPVVQRMRERDNLPGYSHNLHVPLTILSFKEEQERILRALAACLYITYSSGYPKEYHILLDCR